MKKIILLLSIFFILIQVKAQNSSNELSMRYFLGQSKSFIINSFRDCRIEKNEYSKLLIECTTYSGVEKTMFVFKSGLCYEVTLMPMDDQSNSRFLYEVGVLKEEGWIISESSFDGSNIGVIEGAFVKGNISIHFNYFLFGNFINFTVL